MPHDIKEAFNNCLEWQRELGLGNRLESVPQEVEHLLAKVVLLIGGCTQQDVSDIRKGTGQWGVLLEHLQEHAAGLILCGQQGGNLDLQTHRQCIVFDESIL